MVKIFRISALLVFLWLPAGLLGAVDTSLDKASLAEINQMEAQYKAGDYTGAIKTARSVLKTAPNDSPAKMRAHDIIILSVDRQNAQRVEQERTKAAESGKKTAEQLVAEGSGLLREKKFQPALEKFRGAMKAFGGDAETRYLVGYCLQKVDKDADAYVAFKSCLELNKNHPRALFHLAELSFKLQKDEEAETYTRQLIEVTDRRIEELTGVFIEQRGASLNDKALATARKITGLRHSLAQTTFVYGILTARKGKLDESIEALQRSVKLDPTNLDGFYQLGKSYLRKRILHQAAVNFEQAIFMGETRLKEEKARAKKLLDEGKADQAVESELVAKGLANQAARSLYGLAIAEFQRNDVGAAMGSIEKALEIKPDFVLARFARAIFLASRGEYIEGINQMREVLREANPNSPEASQAIKTIKFLMEAQTAPTRSYSGSWTHTQKPPVPTVEMDKFVKFMPGIGGRTTQKHYGDIFYQLKGVQDLLDKHNIPQAIRVLKHLMIRYPELSEIHTMLGHCYMEQGRFDDAIDSFKRGIARNPREPQSLANLAYVFALKGINLPKALEMAQLALSIDDKRPEFHHTLGWVHFKMGEIDKAIAELKKALEIQPTYLLARYNLGLANYLGGSFQAALDCFDQVLAASPGHPKAALFKALAQAKLKHVPDALLTLDDLKKKLPPGEILVKVVDDLHSRLKFAHERNTETPIPRINHPAPIEKLLKQAREFKDKGLVNHAKEIYLECQRLVPERFEPWYELGEMYAGWGLSKPALRAWDQALKIRPNHYGLQLNIGKMQYRLLDRAKAKPAFLAAQALRADDPEPSYYLGLLAYEEQRFESAESHALAAVRLKPLYFKALALLGMARIRLGRFLPARDAYETIYAKAPVESSIRRHARRRLFELARMIAPARAPSVEDAKQFEVETMRRIRKEGRQEIDKGNVSVPPAEKGPVVLPLEEKMWILKRLEDKGAMPVSGPRRLANRGTSGIDEKLWVLKRLESDKKKSGLFEPPPQITPKYKLHDIEKARPVDPADSFLKEGLAAAEKGFLGEALAAFEKGKAASPDNIDVLLNLGFLHTLLGNFKNAFESFAQAALRHPEHPLPRLALGHLYWLGGRGKEAVKQWRGVRGTISLDPDYSFIAKSEGWWKRVLDTNPTDPDGHSNLGIVYLFSNKLIQAIAEFGSVLNLAPDKSEHKFYQAQVYVILYLSSNSSVHKKEAKTRLLELEALSPPFPHARTLRQFLETQ